MIGAQFLFTERQSSPIERLCLFIAAPIMFFFGRDPAVAGLVGVFCVYITTMNVLMMRWEMNVSSIIGSLALLAMLVLWLFVLGFAASFFRIFEVFRVSMSIGVYIWWPVVWMVLVGVSVFKGLFHYYSIGPENLDVQEGITETGENFRREDFTFTYYSKDIIERLFNLGYIVLKLKGGSTFRDGSTIRRVFVWKYSAVVRKLDTIKTLRNVE